MPDVVKGLKMKVTRVPRRKVVTSIADQPHQNSKAVARRLRQLAAAA